MEAKNIVDVLCEDKHGKLIYKCTVKGEYKLAKYAGMKLWLEEKGEAGMLRMLKGLHEYLEKEPPPMKKRIITDLVNRVRTIKYYEVLHLAPFPETTLA